MGPGLIETLIAFCLNFGVGHQQHHFLFVPELQITICQLPPFVNARAKEIAIVHLSKKRNCCFALNFFWDKKIPIWDISLVVSESERIKPAKCFMPVPLFWDRLRLRIWDMSRTHKMPFVVIFWRSFYLFLKQRKLSSIWIGAQSN